jgi:GTP-dependent phosphoenolpyruvate carboxykinase
MRFKMGVYACMSPVFYSDEPPADITCENERACFSMVELRNDGSLGWNITWCPYSTDWNGHYTVFDQHRSERRLRLTSKP